VKERVANEKVTSQKVATLAGVSQSAVSRVFTPGSSVTTDNYAGGKALADFLCATGHERIVHIAGFPGAPMRSSSATTTWPLP
jgi:DNA-binding LacI/PurR family transcriptional regulator